MKDTRFPEKEFMYGILSTLKPDAVRELVASGMKNRWPAAQDDHGDLVEVSGELQHAVMNLFSIKSKLHHQLTIATKQQAKEELTSYWRNPQFLAVNEDPRRNITQTSKNLLNMWRRTTSMTIMIPMKKRRIKMQWINVSLIEKLLSWINPEQCQSLFNWSFDKTQALSTCNII